MRGQGTFSCMTQHVPRRYRLSEGSLFSTHKLQYLVADGRGSTRKLRYSSVPRKRSPMRLPLQQLAEIVAVRRPESRWVFSSGTYLGYRAERTHRLRWIMTSISPLPWPRTALTAPGHPTRAHGTRTRTSQALCPPDTVTRSCQRQ